MSIQTRKGVYAYNGGGGGNSKILFPGVPGSNLKCPRLDCPPAGLFRDRYDPCYSFGGRTI